MSNNKNSLVWTSENGTDFYPTRPVVKEIPNGIYSLSYSEQYGVYLSSLKNKNDKPINLLNNYYDNIKKDFDKFWSMRTRFEDMELEFNRAILLHGQPSSGKKYIARRLAESFDGLTIYSDNPSDLKKIVSYVKDDNPQKEMLLVIEDIGIMLEKHGVSDVVSIFKSKDNYDGIYVIATTNYEEKISEFLSDRPGIFEEKFLIDYPDQKEREEYISYLITKISGKVSKKELNKITKDTDGLSFGYIKNLIESSKIYDYSYEEKLEELKEMKENIVSSFYSDNNIGSNIIGFTD